MQRKAEFSWHWCSQQEKGPVIWLDFGPVGSLLLTYQAEMVLKQLPKEGPIGPKVLLHVVSKATPFDSLRPPGCHQHPAAHPEAEYHSTAQARLGHIAPAS